MAKLEDLPNEVLGEIMIHLSDLHHASLGSVAFANRRLCSVVTPVFNRRWPLVSRSDGANVKSFAYYLAHRLGEAKRVRDIQLPSSNRIVLSRSYIDRQKLQDMATAAAHLWPTCPVAEDWESEILGGRSDSFNALLLLLATEIRALDWTVHSIRSNITLVVARLVSRVAAWVSSRPPQDYLENSAPLLQLRRVRIANEFDGDRHTFAAAFFHLPKLQTFVGERLLLEREDEPDDEGDLAGVYFDSFPDGTSSVEEIILESCFMTLPGLSDIIKACRCLKVFLLKSARKGHFINSPKVVEYLMIHASSLRWLKLERRICDWSELTEDGFLPLVKHFHEFESLECLEIPLEAIFSFVALPAPRTRETRDTVFPDTVHPPRSLRQLRLNADFRASDRTTIVRFCVFMARLFDQCISTGICPKLKLIQIDEQGSTLITFEKFRLQSLARRKDVCLEFTDSGNQKKMPWEENSQNFPRPDERDESSPSSIRGPQFLG